LTDNFKAELGVEKVPKLTRVDFLKDYFVLSPLNNKIKSNLK
jgi:hypothetical protein